MMNYSTFKTLNTYSFGIVKNKLDVARNPSFKTEIILLTA
jgi:hypothetical protein